MIGQFIHGHIQWLILKPGHMMAHSTLKSLRITQQILSALITVFFNSCQKPCDRLHKSFVIHNCIPFITFQPGCRICIIFRKNQCLRVCILYCFSETFPESMIILRWITEICRYVQPPSICIVRRRYPFLSDPKNIITQAFRVFIIPLRQCIMSPPAIIILIIRPIFWKELEKTAIRTLLIHISSRFIVFLTLIDPLSIHPLIEGTAMVKNTVQDNFHTPSMNFFYKLYKKFIAGFQIFFVRNTADIAAGMTIVHVPLNQNIPLIINNSAKVRIHIIIILNIIFVIGWWNKNRIQIQNFDSQILQIIQLIHNPLQITAIKMTDIHVVRISPPVLFLLRMQLHIAVLMIQYIIGWISIAETVCKNLIKNRPLCPVRRLKIRIKFEIIIILCPVHGTALIVNSRYPFFIRSDSGNFKIIIRPALRIMKYRLIIVEISLWKRLMHLSPHTVRHNHYRSRIVLRRPKSQSDTASGSLCTIRCI